MEVFTDDGVLENITDCQFNSNKAGTKTASYHLGMNTDDNGIVLLDEKEMIVDIWNEVNKSDNDKSGGYTSASVRETLNRTIFPTASTKSQSLLSISIPVNHVGNKYEL